MLEVLPESGWGHYSMARVYAGEDDPGAHQADDDQHPGHHQEPAGHRLGSKSVFSPGANQ